MCVVHSAEEKFGGDNSFPPISGALPVDKINILLYLFFLHFPFLQVNLLLAYICLYIHTIYSYDLILLLQLQTLIGYKGYKKEETMSHCFVGKSSVKRAYILLRHTTCFSL